LSLAVGLVGLRDRAVLTQGWMGAFRRSERLAAAVITSGPLFGGIDRSGECRRPLSAT
jgi:hypothetical protein